MSRVEASSEMGFLKDLTTHLLTALQVSLRLQVTGLNQYQRNNKNNNNNNKNRIVVNVLSHLSHTVLTRACVLIMQDKVTAFNALSS